MKTVIARLDSEAAHDLASLTKELGWTSSRIMRIAIHLLAESRRGGMVKSGLGKKPQGLRKFVPTVPGSGPAAEHRKDFSN